MDSDCKEQSISKDMEVKEEQFGFVEKEKEIKKEVDPEGGEIIKIKEEIEETFAFEGLYFDEEETGHSSRDFSTNLSSDLTNSSEDSLWQNTKEDIRVTLGSGITNDKICHEKVKNICTLKCFSQGKSRENSTSENFIQNKLDIPTELNNMSSSNIFHTNILSHSSSSLDNCTNFPLNGSKSLKVNANLNLSCDFENTFNEQMETQSLKPKATLKKAILSNSDSNIFACEVCAKPFKFRRNLKQHMVSHSEEKPHACDICNKGFRRRAELRQHLFNHTYGKSFVCEICEKSYLSKNNLKKHMTIHSEEKPFECEICKKRYKRKDILKQHSYLHSNERSFICDKCYKTFRTKSELRHHMISHSEEKPFVCEICDLTCKTKRNLKFHIVTHSEEKPFVCLVCGNSFRRKYDLTKHMISHSDEKPFVCDMCEKPFKRKDDLKKHISSHYNEKQLLQKCVDSL